MDEDARESAEPKRSSTRIDGKHNTNLAALGDCGRSAIGSDLNINVRFAIAFVLAVATLIAFGVAWQTSRTLPLLETQSVIPYETPSVPAHFQRSFTYPLKFPEPGTPEFDTDDGPSTYLGWHRYGWDDCLATFFHDVRYEDDPMWETTQTEWITVGAPDHRNEARIDGWLDCATRLRLVIGASDKGAVRGKIRAQLADSQRPYVIGYIMLGGILLLAAVLSVAGTRKCRTMS